MGAFEMTNTGGIFSGHGVFIPDNMAGAVGKHLNLIKQGKRGGYLHGGESWGARCSKGAKKAEQ